MVVELLDMYLMDPCWAGRGEGWAHWKDDPYPSKDSVGREVEEHRNDLSVGVEVVVAVVEVVLKQPSFL